MSNMVLYIGPMGRGFKGRTGAVVCLGCGSVGLYRPILVMHPADLVSGSINEACSKHNMRDVGFENTDMIHILKKGEWKYEATTQSL